MHMQTYRNCMHATLLGRVEIVRRVTGVAGQASDYQGTKMGVPILSSCVEVVWRTPRQNYDFCSGANPFSYDSGVRKSSESRSGKKPA